MERDWVYEKVSDDIYWMGNIVLRFNVVLATTNKNGQRNPLHQEYMYESKKYKDQNKLVTVRRNYDYFFSIENSSGYINGMKEFIPIRVQDFPLFRDGIKQAGAWLNDSNIYRYKDNNIVKVGNVDPIIMNFSSLNKTVELEPIVMRSNLNLNTAGIRITIGKDRENFADLTVDYFMGLMYIIENFNMTMAAMTILNYIGNETNRVSSIINVGTDNYNNRYNNNYNIKNGKTGRFVGSNTNKPGLDDL